MSPTRILIPGGGFGGVYAALWLNRRLEWRDDIEVTLVSEHKFVLFSGSSPSVIGLRSRSGEIMRRQEGKYPDGNHE